ncbi:MAG: hypothetical protein ACVCEJ_07420 [Candidatus Izemoplasmataceae bacterium]
MANKVRITKNGHVIYEGNILDIPIKEDAIIKKSIEVFGDEDPCIIHQSFVIKEYTNQLLDHLKETPDHCLEKEKLKEKIDFIDFTDIDKICIELLE